MCSLEFHRPLSRSAPASRPGGPGLARDGRSLLGVGFAALVVSFLLTAPLAQAEPGGALAGVGFDQNLNAQLPLMLTFKDEEGRTVKLADYFGKKPVVLVMNYANCPSLCSTVLNEMTRSLRPLAFSVGKEFDVVTVSIDPRESPERADKQRRGYLKRYNRDGAEAGWHALTGDQAAITKLAQVIGFRFTYNPNLNIYAHSAGFVLLTPAGRISRYFYGVEFPNRELKYALIQAAESKIGSPIDKLVMYCYDYDPNTGKYTFAVMNTIRVLGTATALALGSYVFLMLRRDRRMARASGSPAAELPPGTATL